MNIAIIPARGGSKRIPKKNIKNFCGKPMIAWAIAAAKKSQLFEHIIVSTDDPEIATLARKFGASTPFERPDELADDYTTTVPVISHAISEMNKLHVYADFVCCIYPCAPFVLISDLRDSLEEMKLAGSDFIYPVVEYPHPTFRAMRLGKDKCMEFVFPEYELVRTQDLEKTYHDGGQFYWGKSDAWLAMKRMHVDGTGFVIPSWRTIDIDDEDDWRRAELFFMAYQGDEAQ